MAFDEKYLLLTTFRRDGTPVSTPVWCVPLDEGRFAFETSSGSGKAKRLAHTPRVRFQPCTARGKVVEGTAPADGSARVVEGAELEDIRDRIAAKYGFITKVVQAVNVTLDLVRRRKQPYADRGVIVTVTPP